jgi:hypothetical protein
MNITRGAAPVLCTSPEEFLNRRSDENLPGS